MKNVKNIITTIALVGCLATTTTVFAVDLDDVVDNNDHDSNDGKANFTRGAPVVKLDDDASVSGGSANVLGSSGSWAMKPRGEWHMFDVICFDESGCRRLHNAIHKFCSEYEVGSREQTEDNRWTFPVRATRENTEADVLNLFYDKLGALGTSIRFEYTNKNYVDDDCDDTTFKPCINSESSDGDSESKSSSSESDDNDLESEDSSSDSSDDEPLFSRKAGSNGTSDVGRNFVPQRQQVKALRSMVKNQADVSMSAMAGMRKVSESAMLMVAGNQDSVCGYEQPPKRRARCGSARRYGWPDAEHVDVARMAVREMSHVAVRAMDTMASTIEKAVAGMGGGNIAQDRNSVSTQAAKTAHSPSTKRKKSNLKSRQGASCGAKRVRFSCDVVGTPENRVPLHAQRGQDAKLLKEAQKRKDKHRKKRANDAADKLMTFIADENVMGVMAVLFARNDDGKWFYQRKLLGSLYVQKILDKLENTKTGTNIQGLLRAFLKEKAEEKAKRPYAAAAKGQERMLTHPVSVPENQAFLTDLVEKSL